MEAWTLILSKVTWNVGPCGGGGAACCRGVPTGQCARRTELSPPRASVTPVTVEAGAVAASDPGGRESEEDQGVYVLHPPPPLTDHCGTFTNFTLEEPGRKPRNQLIKINTQNGTNQCGGSPCMTHWEPHMWVFLPKMRKSQGNNRKLT